MHLWNEPDTKKVICDSLKGDSWLPAFRKVFINNQVPEKGTCAGSLWAAFLLRPENQASGVKQFASILPTGNMKNCYFFSACFFGFLTTIYAVGRVNPACLEKEKAIALLETAKNFLTKAEVSFPSCSKLDDEILYDMNLEN
ncbi:hypothetical protein AVEN_169636-1 [Araneus ventricosus]|uniref:Uncharacterized protein n=1 Tax=Araneus ventricosus TaxID=182803 RepID=A0A4Y2U716_ARAVE|nr:hypothetical protein AVEN_169636-1 [Araneus ventricosus]